MPHVPRNETAPKGQRQNSDRDITAFQHIRKFENPARTGRRKDGLWEPHHSPEKGFDTIGYGHKLTEDEVRSGTIKIGDRFVAFDPRGTKGGKLGLSDEDIDELQHQDMKKFTDFTGQFNMLTNNQRTALTSLVYNVGLASFKGGKKETKTFAALKEYQATGDPAQLEVYLQEAYGENGFNKMTVTDEKTKVKKKVLSAGLVTRRADEMKLSRKLDQPRFVANNTPERPPRPNPLGSS